MNEQTAIIPMQSSFLAPAAALSTVLEAYQAKKEFIERVLKPDVDFGVIPGSAKLSLLKPGAEKMATFFGLAPVFEDVQIIEDWTGEDHNGEPFFYYREKCKLYRGERMIASADGSCNSWEKKYRYRYAERVCPNCGKPAIIKGKQEYGGGYVCFDKKGGCKAKFRDGDPAIEGQQLGQVKNPDVAEQVNTILKMAQKRALVAATLIATNASDYFTQDIEDFVSGEIIEGMYRDTNQPEQTQQTAAVIQTEQPEQNATAGAPPMSLEEAKVIKNKDGVAYGDLSAGQLQYLANSLGSLEKPTKEQQDKLLAVQIIRKARNGQPA